MFSKTLLAFAALGVVSVWYVRSRAPFEAARGVRRRLDAALSANLRTDSDAERKVETLQHSQAMGVAGGIERTAPVA